MALRTSLLAVGCLVSGIGLVYGCSSDDTGAAAASSGGVGGDTAAASSSYLPSAGVEQGGTGGSNPTSASSGGLTCSEEYTNIPKGECDLLAQDCASGTFCGVATVDGAKTTKCVPDLGGVKDKGADCVSNSECKSGLTCVDNHCSPFCCPATDEPCDGGTCDVNLNFEMGKTAFAMACSYLTICDLFAGNCAEGMDCHLSDATACLAVCDSPSDNAVSEGGDCMYRNDCGESQLCNNNSPDMGVCRYFCDTTKADQPAGKGGCPQDRMCKPAGGTGCSNLGLCVPI